MVVRRVLTRLLRLRELEEELSRIELEAAVVEKNAVEREIRAVAEREAQGRSTFVAGIEDRDHLRRASGLMEIQRAASERLRMDPLLDAAESNVAMQREAFLARRTGRMQVETLENQARRDAHETAVRKAQQMLDDWYGQQGRRDTANTARSRIGPCTC